LKTQEEWIREVGQEVIELLIKKDHDYGSSFSESYKEYGIVSGVMRMDDKIKRLKNIIKGSEIKVKESSEDTCLDLCGYAMLLLTELKKETNEKN
jgi:hypothetical protein